MKIPVISSFLNYWQRQIFSISNELKGHLTAPRAAKFPEAIHARTWKFTLFCRYPAYYFFPANHFFDIL